MHILIHKAQILKHNKQHKNHTIVLKKHDQNYLEKFETVL